MPQVIEVDLLNKPRALEEELRYINPKATPFVSLLPVGPNPKSMKLESNIKRYVRGNRTPIADATAASSFNSNVATPLAHVAQWFRHPVAVGKLAQLVNTATEAAGEQITAQIDDGLFTLKQLLEEQFSSDDDLAEQGVGGATAYRARGIFSYASPSAQTNLPVPAAFRPAAGQYVEGDLDAGEFSETVLKAMIAAQQIKTDGMAMELEALCGIHMQQVFDNFTSNQTNETGKTAIARYDREDPAHFVNTVNSLSLSGAEINLHTTTHLLRAAADGAETDATHKSMVAFDRNMLSVRYLQSPGAEELAPDGSGPRVDLTAVAMMVVENPTALMAFEHVPTAP